MFRRDPGSDGSFAVFGGLISSPGAELSSPFSIDERRPGREVATPFGCVLRRRLRA